MTNIREVGSCQFLNLSKLKHINLLNEFHHEYYNYRKFERLKIKDIISMFLKKL